MATTKQAAAAAAAENTDAREETTTTSSTDAPVLDSLGAEIKKLIQKGKERGYVTWDELNAALPSDGASSEQIEDTQTMLNDMGINIVEGEDQEEVVVADDKTPVPARSMTDSEKADEEEEIGRTD